VAGLEHLAHHLAPRRSTEPAAGHGLEVADGGEGIEVSPDGVVPVGPSPAEFLLDGDGGEGALMAAARLEDGQALR